MKAGIREVVLFPHALDALQNQKAYTLLHSERVFHNPRTNKPWETDQQTRKTAWRPALIKANLRYRNPYQTRHTWASMLLSGGDNPWWVANQLGHETIEMIMRHYGKWIPASSKKQGHQSGINWDETLNKTTQ
jgi:integrase